MKYILLGKLNTDWIAKKKRVDKAREKLSQLGITIEEIYYTQGAFDFVDVATCAAPEAMMAFSVWYAAQGFGAITTMPAFSTDQFDNILSKL